MGIICWPLTQAKLDGKFLTLANINELCFAHGLSENEEKYKVLRKAPYNVVWRVFKTQDKDIKIQEKTTHASITEVW